MEGRLCVLGAPVGSLGEAIASEAELLGYETRTAGISGDEDDRLERLYLMKGGNEFDYVVCTIGINEPDNWRKSLETNVELPLHYMETWLAMRMRVPGIKPGAFVFISSNSAHVARGNSEVYCATKAALSMAVRCRARDIAREYETLGPSFIYAYEPGFIAGTPMSQEVTRRLSKTMSAREAQVIQMHRMPGVWEGMDRRLLGRLIAMNLTNSRILHGSTLRVDLGDQ